MFVNSQRSDTLAISKSWLWPSIKDTEGSLYITPFTIPIAHILVHGVTAVLVADHFKLRSQYATKAVMQACGITFCDILC